MLQDGVGSRLPVSSNEDCIVDNNHGGYMKIEPNSLIKENYQEDTGLKKRVIHLIIDYWIMGFISITIFQFLLGFFCGLIKIDLTSISRIGSFIINLSSIILYFIIFEKIFGKTVGKMLTKTIVLTKDLTKPSIGQIILRSIIRFIPFEPISVFGGDFWHDKWSGTVVAKKVE